MATVTMILGESGTGKSCSIRNLPPEKTFVIKSIDKDLPFKGGNKFHLRVSDNAGQIKQWLAQANLKDGIKVIIIDDFQYIMCNEWMRSLMDKQTKDSEFHKYKKIGHDAWSILMDAMRMRDDISVFILSHTEQDQWGKTKIKTIGKLLDEKVTLEGLVTICLHTKVEGGKYYLETVNNGSNTVKSPMGLFNESKIPNDLNMVIESINIYKGE